MANLSECEQLALTITDDLTRKFVRYTKKTILGDELTYFIIEASSYIADLLIKHNMTEFYQGADRKFMELYKETASKGIPVADIDADVIVNEMDKLIQNKKTTFTNNI